MSQPVEKSFIIKYDAYSCPGYQYIWMAVCAWLSISRMWKKRKNLIPFLFRNGIRRAQSVCGLFLICTARNGMKENQRRQTHHVPCVCPQVSVVGRHVARASQQENWTKAFPSLSFFLPHVQLDSFLSTTSSRTPPGFWSNPFAELGSLWLGDGSVRHTAQDPTSKAFWPFSQKARRSHFALIHVA